MAQILREKRDDKFSFKENLLSRLPNPVELSHKWVLTNLKYQELEFYYRFFDESDKVPFEFTPVCTEKKLVFSAHCHLHLTFLVINFLLIVINMKLKSR